MIVIMQGNTAFLLKIPKLIDFFVGRLVTLCISTIALVTIQLHFQNVPYSKPSISYFGSKKNLSLLPKKNYSPSYLIYVVFLRLFISLSITAFIFNF